MSYEKAIGGNVAEHRGFRIVRFLLRRRHGRLGQRSAAFINDSYVAQHYVFNSVTGHAADDRRKARFDVVRNEVADLNTAQRANPRAGWSAHPASQSQKYRRIYNVAHRDIADRDVFEDAAVKRL